MRTFTENERQAAGMIESLRSGAGGYTRKAVESVGVQWPLSSGWRQRLGYRMVALLNKGVAPEDVLCQLGKVKPKPKTKCKKRQKHKKRFKQKKLKDRDIYALSYASPEHQHLLDCMKPRQQP